jgi:hypothetical protein
MDDTIEGQMTPKLNLPAPDTIQSVPLNPHKMNEDDIAQGISPAGLRMTPRIQFLQLTTGMQGIDGH